MGHYRLDTCEIYKGSIREFHPTRAVLSFNIQHESLFTTIYVYCLVMLFLVIKDRNGMDLTEAEDMKKRWQEYTEDVYKKDLHDQDNHDGMITHLEQRVRHD